MLLYFQLHHECVARSGWCVLSVDCLQFGREEWRRAVCYFAHATTQSHGRKVRFKKAIEKISFLAMWKENSLTWITLVVILHRMKEKLMQILIVHPNLKVKAELRTVGRAALRWECLSQSSALCLDFIRIVDTGAFDCSHASESKSVRAFNWLRLFCSKEFFGKIGFVRSLSDLSRVQSVQFADVPMPVRNYDRRHQRNVMTNTCC